LRESKDLQQHQYLVNLMSNAKNIQNRGLKVQESEAVLPMLAESLDLNHNTKGENRLQGRNDHPLRKSQH